MDDELQRDESQQQAQTSNRPEGADEVPAVEELISRATEALAEGRMQAAMAAARQACEQGPELARTWALLAMVAEEAGELREALQAYRRVAELDPDRPGVAEAVERLEGEVEEGEREEQPAPAVRRIEHYAPAFLAASVALLVFAIGLAFVVHGRRVSRAEAAYRAVMDQGMKYMALQEFARAEAAFADALRLKPDDPNALSWLQRARKNREQLAKLQQWEYLTHGGKFPGIRGQALAPARITPTAERRAQQAAQQRASSSTRPAAPPRRYTWRGAGEWTGTSGPGQFPSPRTEFSPLSGFGAPAGSPVYPQPQGPPASASSTAGTGQAPQQVGAQGSGQAQGQAPTQQEPSKPEPPQGYVRITVGEPRPQDTTPAEARPKADDVRAQADAARKAGQLDQAARLYRRAEELYRSEAQADPQARAVKEAAADYCRRVAEQCASQP